MLDKVLSKHVSNTFSYVFNIYIYICFVLDTLKIQLEHMRDVTWTQRVLDFDAFFIFLIYFNILTQILKNLTKYPTLERSEWLEKLESRTERWGRETQWRVRCP